MKEMEKFETGAIREDKTGKGRCDLLPMCALIRLSKHYEKGSADHGERNWEKGIPMHSFLDSAIRHLFKYMDGQTSEDHLSAAAWNILGAMWTEEKHPEMQDIPSRPVRCPPLAQRVEDGTGGFVTKRTQERASRGLGMCNCYDVESQRCNGTKEREHCGCMGAEADCDFYPQKRIDVLTAANELP